MTRLLRSPFPVAPSAPAILQHDLFGGPPEAVDAPGDATPSTPAMRRWCEIGGPESATVRELGLESLHAVEGERADPRHGSKPGTLARPRHSSGSARVASSTDRELALLERSLRTRAPRVNAEVTLEASHEGPSTNDTPDAPSCGRAAGHAASSGRSSRDRSARSTARKRPIIIRRRRVQVRSVEQAPTDVRNVGARMVEVTGRSASTALPMTSPTQAQPEWSCATAWLRSAEASGEGSMQQVTAAASYMFVAVMLAFTFVI